MPNIIKNLESSGLDLYFINKYLIPEWFNPDQSGTNLEQNIHIAEIIHSKIRLLSVGQILFGGPIPKISTRDILVYWATKLATLPNNGIINPVILYIKDIYFKKYLRLSIDGIHFVFDESGERKSILNLGSLIDILNSYEIDFLEELTK